MVHLSRSFRETNCQYLVYAETVYSGLNRRAGEMGILLSKTLVHPPPPAELVSQLDARLRKHLLKEKDYITYQVKTELAMQYSHDDLLGVFAGPEVPAVHFLNVHGEFSKTSDKNQDVIMVGKSLRHKRAALSSIQNELIAQGYARISFLNTDSGYEEICYDSGQPGKEYRVLWASGMSHTSMLAGYGLSGPLCGATGDQSLGEALSSNKFMLYECLYHKKSLIENYDWAMKAISGNDPDVVETLRLLRRARSASDYQQLGDRLRNPSIQLKLQRCNQAVLAQYDFVRQIIDAKDQGELKLSQTMADDRDPVEEHAANTVDWKAKLDNLRPKVEPIVKPTDPSPRDKPTV